MPAIERAISSATRELLLLLPGEPTALRNRPRSFQTNESAQRG